MINLERIKKRYRKKAHVLTPGNSKPRQKHLESEKEKFLLSKGIFGFHVKFSGGKRKRRR